MPSTFTSTSTLTDFALKTGGELFPVKMRCSRLLRTTQTCARAAGKERVEESPSLGSLGRPFSNQTHRILGGKRIEAGN